MVTVICSCLRVAAPVSSDMLLSAIFGEVRKLLGLLKHEVRFILDGRSAGTRPFLDASFSVPAFLGLLSSPLHPFGNLCDCGRRRLCKDLEASLQQLGAHNGSILHVVPHLFVGGPSKVIYPRDIPL